MNRAISNGGVYRSFLMEIRIRDFEICWAGPNPVGPGLCFGSEEGWLLFTDADGDRWHTLTREPCPEKRSTAWRGWEDG